MTRKNRIISIAILATLAFVVLCASGITLAMNATANRTQGTISTASLKLSATAKNVAVYTAIAAEDGDEGTFDDGHGNLYKHQQCNLQNNDGTILFGNRSGGVSFREQSVSIENMMPGDKVEFDIEVKNLSNVAFDYRAELYVDDTNGKDLLNQLVFSAGELGVLRKDVTKDASDDDLKQAVLTDYTETVKIGASTATIDKVRISVELPITADKGQGQEIKFYYVVRANQNTAMRDVASVVAPNGETVTFEKLSAAVNYAQSNNIRNISVIDSTVLEEGEVVVDRAVNFVGVADSQGNYPTLVGARVTVRNGATVSFKNVNFDGVSYIDVSGAMALTLDNCKAEVSPAEFYDVATRDFLQDAAFIVSGTSLTPVKLSVVDSSIFSTNGGSVISLRSPLSDGSLISRNVFGSDKFHYDGVAAMAFNGAYKTDSVSEYYKPTVVVSDNTVHGNRVLSLGGNAGATPYLVSSLRNVAYGVAEGQFVCGALNNGGIALGVFVDNGSKIDGNGLTVDNIAAENLILGGVDVTLNGINLITKGRIVLSEHIGETAFYNLHAAESSQTNGDIVLFKNDSRD